MSQSGSESIQGRGIALVTGGTGGIGQATCRALCEAGFTVAIHTHRRKELAAELSRQCPGSFVVEADLSDAEQIEAMVEVIKRHPQPLRVLVNNAGFTVDAPIFTAKLEDFDRMFEVNVRAAWLLAKKCSRLMIRQKSGRILFVSSVVASTGNPMQTSYAMTKAALENLTRSLARELAGHGILVNAVAPGLIDTPMTEAIPETFRQGILEMIPMARTGKPEEVATWIRFLASDAPYCTGSVIHVDGGISG